MLTPPAGGGREGASPAASVRLPWLSPPAAPPAVRPDACVPWLSPLPPPHAHSSGRASFEPKISIIIAAIFSCCGSEQCISSERITC